MAFILSGELHSQLGPAALLYNDLVLNFTRSSRSKKLRFPFDRGDVGRDFEHLLNLYVPRIMKPGEAPDTLTLLEEIERLGQRYADNVQTVRDIHYGPREWPMSPRECSFEQLDDNTARMILEKCHYLASFRKNSLHFGLTYRGYPVALASFSDFDLMNIATVVGDWLEGARVLQLSRFYSFSWAPVNSTSYLISKALGYLRTQHRNLDLVLTYVNPNIGYYGTSSRAANMTLFGYETGTEYKYLNGEYVTDRILLDQFGTLNQAVLRRKAGQKFEVSSIELEPLPLYAHFYNQRLKRALQPLMPFTFPHPKDQGDYHITEGSDWIATTSSK